MYQYQLINCRKHTTSMQEVNNGKLGAVRGYVWTLCMFRPIFSVNLKLLKSNATDAMAKNFNFLLQRKKKYYTQSSSVGKNLALPLLGSKLNLQNMSDPSKCVVSVNDFISSPITNMESAYGSCLYSTIVSCVPATWGHSLLHKTARSTGASSQFFFFAACITIWMRSFLSFFVNLCKILAERGHLCFVGCEHPALTAGLHVSRMNPAWIRQWL